MPDYQGGPAWNSQTQPLGSTVTPGWVQYAVPAAAQLYNAYSQNQANQQNNAYSSAMYNTQRKDALSDWYRMAEYNSPKNQMKMYKEAGLNPNLIYGKQIDSPSVRSSSPAQGQYVPSKIDLNTIGQNVSEYQNIIKSKQETNNLKANIDLISANTLLTKVKAFNELTYGGDNTLSQTEKNRQETAGLKTMLPEQKANLETTTQKLIADIKSTTDKNTRENDAFPLEQAKRKLDNIEISLRNAKTKEETQNLIQQRDKVTAEIANLSSGTDKNIEETKVLTEKVLQEKMETFLRNNGASYHDNSVLRNFINWISGGGGKDFNIK